MKKGVIPMIILIVLLALLIIVGIVVYNLLYVPKNYVLKIENAIKDETNIVYIYENGKVLLNKKGMNTIKYKISEDDVNELLEEIENYEIEVEGNIYVVTTADGKEINVTNAYLNIVEEKLGIKENSLFEVDAE